MAVGLLQVMVEAYRRDAASKEQLIAELRSTKQRLAAEVSELRQALLDAQGETRTALAEQGHLRLELQRVQEQMSGLEAHLQAVQTERDQLDQQIQVHTWYTHGAHMVHTWRTHGTRMDSALMVHAWYIYIYIYIYAQMHTWRGTS